MDARLASGSITGPAFVILFLYLIHAHVVLSSSWLVARECCLSIGLECFWIVHCRALVEHVLLYPGRCVFVVWCQWKLNSEIRHPAARNWNSCWNESITAWHSFLCLKLAFCGHVRSHNECWHDFLFFICLLRPGGQTEWHATEIQMGSWWKGLFALWMWQLVCVMILGIPGNGMASSI